MSQRRLYIVLFVIANVTVFYITPIMYSFRSDKFPIYYFLLRAFLLILSLLLLPLIFKKIIKRIENKIKSGLLSISIVFLLIFYLSELFFTFYPETNGKNDTYCSKTWMYYYWKLNNYGFRDIDFGTNQPDKPAIIFVGDSYTEGHGIKDPNNRVSDLVRKRLSGFSIYNVGKNGMDINNELDLIQHIPIHPDILILQICSNDWDYLSNKLSKNTAQSPLLFAETKSFSLSKYSVLLNYLHSKLKNILENLFSYRLDENELEKVYNSFKIDNKYRITNRNNLAVLEHVVNHSPLPEDSIQHLLFTMFKEFNSSLKIMTDTTLFSDYLEKLNDVKRFCNQQKTTLIIVPYPNMDQFSMKVSNKYINRYLCNLISVQGINCLDVFPSLKLANLKTYTVNSSDNHINEAASKVIADTLVQYIHKNILKL